MSDLSKLPNIGNALAVRLEEVGIKSENELKILGSEKVFLLLKGIDPTTCINTLFALEGAVQGIRWHNLDKVKKEELKMFFDLCE